MATKNEAIEKKIIKQVLYRDSNSFKLLIDRYQNHIFSIGMRFFNNEEDACDFVQEVFIKAYANLASYKGLAPFRFWLMKIAYNHGINKKKIQNYHHLDQDNAVISEESSPEDIHMKKEAKEALLAAIKKLPQQYQVCLDLYFFLGLTYNEIGNITKLPLNTIKSHVFRAKEVLRNSLRGTAAEDYGNEV